MVNQYFFSRCCAAFPLLSTMIRRKFGTKKSQLQSRDFFVFGACVVLMAGFGRDEFAFFRGGENRGEIPNLHLRCSSEMRHRTGVPSVTSVVLAAEVPAAPHVRDHSPDAKRMVRHTMAPRLSMPPKRYPYKGGKLSRNYARDCGK